LKFFSKLHRGFSAKTLKFFTKLHHGFSAKALKFFSTEGWGFRENNLRLSAKVAVKPLQYLKKVIL
jgi:hypothetical protein